jgi:hypothetical protein
MNAIRATLLCALGIGIGGWGGCDGGGTSVDEVMKLCARASACMDPGDPTSFGQQCDTIYLVSRNADQDQSTEYDLLDSIIECIRRAADCDAIRACVKANPSQAAQCDGLGGQDVCVGSVMIECTGLLGDVPDAFDCAAAGLVCGERGGDASCGESLCDPDTDQMRCDGHRLVECTSEGVWVAEDCRYDIGLACSGGPSGFTCQVEAGGTCGSGQDGELDCVGTGVACDPDTFVTRCDGAVLVSCRQGKEARLDCKNLAPEYTCGQDARIDGMNCVAAANECLPDHDESCTGSVISFCSLGEIRELDCLAQGMSGCSSANAGDQTVAWCTD